MDRIKNLYGSFTRHEQRIFKNYLNAFHTKGENKQLILLELIEKKPTISLEEASGKLYNEPKSKAFFMLKARLYEKLTEFISLSVSALPTDTAEEDPLNLAVLEYRKCMLAATTLRMRGHKELARDFFSQAIDIAREIDCPELELDPLLRLKAMAFYRNPAADEKSLFEELSDAMQRQEVDLNAIAIYHHFNERFVNRSGNEDERHAYLMQHLPQLQELLANKYSVRAHYYILHLEINHLGRMGKWEECARQSHVLVDLISRHKGLQNNRRMAMPYLHLSIAEAYLGNWQASMAALDTLDPFVKGLVIPEWTILQQRLSTFMLAGHIEAAGPLAEKLDYKIKNPDFPIKPEMLTNAVYLVACYHYFTGKLQKAWQKLQEIPDLNHDKTGWNTGVRIFEIMLLIEMEENDLVSLKIENLRKHMSKYEPDERSRIIYRIFVAMDKKGHTFQKVKDADELLKALSETRYLLFGHEVVRFETWFEKNRAKGR